MRSPAADQVRNEVMASRAQARALIDRAALWQRVHALEAERQRLASQTAAGSAASAP